MTRNLRIISGLVLFLFVALHLSNLAVAVFSIPLAEASRRWFMLPFSNPVGGYLLLASALVHMILGLQSLYQRNTLRMTTHDTVQFVSALLIPPLLIPHVWGLVGGSLILGSVPTYPGLFKLFWINAPLEGLRQILLVVVIWIHGCIGLFTWLRLKQWWPRFSSFAYPLAVAIPVMAMLGFVAGGNYVLDPSFEAADKSLQTKDAYSSGGYSSDAYSSDAYSSDGYSSDGYSSGQVESPDPQTKPVLDAATRAEKRAFIHKVRWQMIFGYLAMVLAVLVARFLRIRGRDQFVDVHYADGSVLRALAGPTLLEIANMNDMLHANLCHGRGRCGTCRVRVLHSDGELPPPLAMELATLSRTDSNANERLACQLSPGPGVIRLERLYSPDIQPTDLFETETIAEIAEEALDSEAAGKDVPV